MKTSWLLALVAGVGMLLLVEPMTAMAEKPFPGKLLGVLSILHKNNQDSCKVCHTQTMNPDTKKPDPKWNSFGDAMKKAYDDLKTKNGKAPNFEEMFAEAKDLDSDGDGASNIIELVAGTKPGDAASKPTDDEIKAAKDAIAKMAAPAK